MVQPSLFTFSCNCVVPSECNNLGPYHHTNAAYNLEEIFPNPLTTRFYLHVTAASLCWKRESSHYAVEGLNRHTSTKSRMIVFDNDSVKIHNVSNWLGDTNNIIYVTGTIVHELGHAYGVEDHYDIHYFDARDDCLWGYNHDDEDINDHLQMCSVCYSTIRDNTSVNHS